jgi:proton-translocating NADH-quinone oxidoreductase chain L
MAPVSTLPTLLATAWLLPLASFTLILFFGPRMGKAGKYAGYLATAAIATSCAISLFALLLVWLPANGVPEPVHHAAAEHGHEASAGEGEHETPAHAEAPHGNPLLVKPITGDWYTLGKFGSLRLTIGYYIDSLTLLMFSMVTIIATCIHFYAYGYMHNELHEVVDHEVHVSGGGHLHRPGRFSRFFQYLSLFCFSMLGIVIAGNVAMVFVFWELVGICSYFLIGFYYERHSASTAANKAFIVNRIGDFGMIIGLMALITSLGTFNFGDIDYDQSRSIETTERGIFSQVRSEENGFALQVPEGMVRSTPPGQDPYWLLVIAGVGIFCGCVGKSAQFPLQVWLPDAMEGPTPVSALVHSATMVAAGVYLVGRFFPVFAPEVLLVIAIIGCITLFIAATIAITATDIKRVLAYSTVSQLGYMMLALGVGGWSAGMFHLVTHAFFKSLLFMCSGSVIHACHTNDMTKMGGLRKKMPWTAYTMLVGCLAIMGAGVPFSIWLAFSGHYSKDAILAQALSFKAANPQFALLFYVAAGGAAITAFYMFRLWFMTFAGEPRDRHIYDHAHESPRIMYYPLVVLSVFAIGAGWSIFGFGVQPLLEQARPAGILAETHGKLLPNLVHPNEHDSHLEHVHVPATLWATGTALSGFLLAVLFYGLRVLDPREVRNQFRPIYEFLLHKWYFDELYNVVFVQPVLFIARRIAEFDKKVIDGFIDNLAVAVRMVATIDDLIDRYFVDGIVNVVSRWIFGVGEWLHGAETGKLRQYVMFIVIGTVAIFVLVTFYLKNTLAAP